MSKRIVTLVLICLCLFNIFTITTRSDPSITIRNQTIKAFNSLNLINDPINITNNVQLAIQAASGDGSSGNPYILGNYIIDCNSTKIGINIQNTNKYFVLQNISVSHCSIGFYLSHVIFVSIINSFAINNSDSGFALYYSSHINLINNTAMYNNYYGFSLAFSSHNSLTNNKAIKNNYDKGQIPLGGVINGNIGFILGSSSYNSLTNNIATSNDIAGFDLLSSSYNSLTNNKVTNSGTGFLLETSVKNTLIGNTATNTYNSFELESSSNNTLISNIASKNIGIGFYCILASNNILTSNTASNNDESGFYFYSSSNNLLESNRAIKNTDYGFYFFLSPDNRLRNNIAQNNLKYDYYSLKSNGTNLLFNRFLTVHTSPLVPFDSIAFIEAICIIIFISGILMGLLSLFSSKNEKFFQKRNISASITQVEDILTESYQVLDYKTAEKIQLGGFPDYIIFKQALDKGITSYTE